MAYQHLWSFSTHPKVDETEIKLSLKRVENMGKGENANNQDFLLFPIMISKSSCLHHDH